MLEVSELKLPVDHSPEDIARSVAVALQAPHGEILDVKVYKRAIDARKGRVLLNYTVHVTVRDEAAALAHFRPGLARVQVRPDRDYRELAGVMVREKTRTCVRWWWAAVRAVCFVPCCWRGTAGGRFCWSGARPRAPGRAT